MRITTRAVVLREADYKESDKILTLLTPELGKITAQAHGCRRKGNGLSAACQLLVYSEMTLSEYRGRWTVAEAAVELEWRTLRRELDRLALGTYFAQVLESVVPEDSPPEELLPLLLNCLYALDRLEVPLEEVKAAFELRCMSLAGFAPMLEGCAVCGREHPEGPMLNLRQGVLHCADCGAQAGEGISLPVSDAVLAAMEHIVNCPGKRLLAFRLPTAGLQALGGVCEAYLLSQMERGFGALDYYKQVRIPGISPDTG